MYSHRHGFGTFLSLLTLFTLSSIPATAQRLTVNPDFVFFTQTGSTAPAPVMVKIGAASGPGASGRLGAFTASTSTLSGGSWLSVSPTQGSGSTTLTVGANTTGLAAGEYSGTVTITAAGFANSPYNLGVSLTILAPALTVRPGSLTFGAVAGGAAPASQSLLVSLLGGGSFSFTASATVTTPSGGTWLKISPSSGTNGTTLVASVDPTGLAAGTYRGQIEVSGVVGGATSAVEVPVTLTVTTPPPPALQLNPSSLTFVYDPSGANPLVIPAIQVTNRGSGTINWTAEAAVNSPSGGTWLSVNPASGSTPGTVAPVVSPTGLAPGTYSGIITVTGTEAGVAGTLSAQALVFLTVRPPAAPEVSVTPEAVAFDFADSVLTPPSSAVSVTSGSSGLSFTAVAATAKGGDWLTVSPASGTVTSSSSVTVGVSSSVAASLSAGIYTGTVTIKVPGAARDTFTVPASLQVFASGLTPFFKLEPGALLFASQPNLSNPAPQSVNLRIIGSTTLGWSANVTTVSGGSWLSVSPSSGAGSTAIQVSVDDSNLKNGLYSGSVTFNAASGSATKPVTLQVRLIVGSIFAPGSAAAGTAPQPMFTLPAEGFASTEGLPINVGVMVVDGRGAAIDNAVVTVRSSNGEPDLTLDSVGGGLYTALFRPLASGPVVLTATAVASQTASAPKAVSGDVVPSGAERGKP
jgi:trimeric autotransporter adhesin